MLGKNHIVVNLASVTMLGTATVALAQQSSESPLGALAPVAMNTINYMATNGAVTLPSTGLECNFPILPGNPSLLFDTYLFWVVTFLFFTLGSLLPDIDSDNSLLGRYVRIGVQHRTWTHSVWGLPFLCFAGVYFRPMLWCALGVFLHLFWDSLSVGGNCWFYPFSKYIDYSSGAHVKQHHWAKLYRVGGLSEQIIVYALVIMALLCIGWLVYGTVNPRILVVNVVG